MYKKIVLITALLVVLSGCDDKIKNEKYQGIKETVETLTSDEMEGRLTGTKGNELAVQHIEEKFKEIGLDTIQQNSYLMEYPHMFYNPEKLNFQVKITSEKGETIELKRGIDFLERTGFTSYNVESRYTLDISDSQLEDSFVVLNNSKDFQQAFEKAKGILVVEKLYRTLSVDSLEKPVIQITQKTYDKLKKTPNGQIQISSSAESKNIQAKNVVGKISGKDSNNAVVISAHFDHVGTVNDTIYRGAIDNASGLSVLLEVAQKLKDANVKYEKDIIIVAFNGEESGLQGSYHFTNSIKDKYEHVYNINIDSINEGPITLVSLEEEISNELLGDLQVSFDESDQETKVDISGNRTSDHSNFLYHHMNAISISSQNIMKKIHLPSDTMEEIDLPLLYQVSEILTKFIIEHDNKNYEHEHKTVELSEDERIKHEGLKKITDKELAALKYNEYKLLEYGKEKTLTRIKHDIFKFEDLQEFRFYYPNFEYPENINEFTLRDINVTNNFSDQIEWYNLEVNKVYKIETSTSDLNYVNLGYYSQNDPKRTFGISINKGKINDRDKDKKELNLNNKSYYLNYDSEYLTSISFERNINNQIYLISLYRGNEVNVELDGKKVVGVKSDLTKDEVEDIIRNYNIEEIVEELLGSL